MSLTSHHQGFTLIELVMTIIILSFAAMVVTSAITSFSHSSDAVLREQATSLAQAMMDEVLAKKWDNTTASGGGPIVTSETITGSRGTDGTRIATITAALGPETAAPDNENATADDRSDWNDIDDYNGASEPVGGFFFDQTGSQLPNTFSGFSRTVSVNYIASNAPSIDATTPTSATTATDSKRIVVSVSSPLGETFTLVAIACNF